MAVYRTVHVTFWQDPFVLELIPKEKYFYLYLMTNSKTNQIGCYEISKIIMKTETGYEIEEIDELIEKFVGYGKAKYSEKTKEMLLVNWYKYSWSKSPTVAVCILREFENVKNQGFREHLHRLLTQYGYSMDSLCIKEEEEETKEKEETKSKEEEQKERCAVDYKRIVESYNNICISLSKVSSISEARKKAIGARLNQYSYEDFNTMFTKAENSAFLKGSNDRNWTANFDWLIKDSNMAKVLDDNYKDKTKKKTEAVIKKNGFHNFEEREIDGNSLEQRLLHKGELK